MRGSGRWEDYQQERTTCRVTTGWSRDWKIVSLLSRKTSIPGKLGQLVTTAVVRLWTILSNKLTQMRWGASLWKHSHPPTCLFLADPASWVGYFCFQGAPIFCPLLPSQDLQPLRDSGHYRRLRVSWDTPHPAQKPRGWAEGQVGGVSCAQCAPCPGPHPGYCWTWEVEAQKHTPHSGFMDPLSSCVVVTGKAISLLFHLLLLLTWPWMYTGLILVINSSLRWRKEWQLVVLIIPDGSSLPTMQYFKNNRDREAFLLLSCDSFQITLEWHTLLCLHVAQPQNLQRKQRPPPGAK